MFGFVICDKNGLDESEKERYQEYYCGLCLELKKNYGQMGRMSLNYDMTFLALFLSSLYEPEESEKEFRCAAHPLKKQKLVTNAYVEYAAAMTIILAYHKCIDDWEDEKNMIGKQYGKLLKKSYLKVLAQYPRQCRAVEEAIRNLHLIEKNPKSVPDEAVNCSGKMLAELFVMREDFWSNSLRCFGYELGRFIYIMDAAMDYKTDQKKKTYNPLIRMNKTPDDIIEILESEMGRATVIFETLPMVQDSHLIRNILYSGVWLKYSAQRMGKEKKE